MVMTQKCNKCLHEHVCSYKAEYLAACDALENASYSMPDKHGDGRMCITRYRDADIQVEVKCPHRLVGTVSQLRDGAWSPIVKEVNANVDDRDRNCGGHVREL